MKNVLILGFLLLAINSYGSFVNPNYKPAIRSGTLPVRDIFLFVKSAYLKKNEYGEHTYWTKYKEGLDREKEKNGMTYTCLGGFLDMAHVRNAIDWVGYLASKLYKEIENNQETYIHQGEEATLYTIRFNYPKEYLALSEEEKREVAKVLSVKVAQQVAYQSLVWHEIVTWSGYIHEYYSERPSGFSFEDNYSNILGIMVGGLAVFSPDSFNEAADYYLKYYLNLLTPIEKQEAIDLIDSLASRWWNPNYLLPLNKKIIKRHLDYGQFDNLVRPWQVENVLACQHLKNEKMIMEIPKLDEVHGIDFSNYFNVEVKSNLAKQDRKIEYYFKDNPRIVDKMIPPVHFPMIVEIIRSDLKKMMNDPYADQPGIIYP